MKKTIILALALALLGGAAYANFGSRDTVPAATLLVPYIVVDANALGVPDPAGYTTLTVVTNVSSAKQIIHVTVYNAWSRGVVDFDEVLSGYDVWSINWRDVVTGDFQNFDTGSASGGFWSGSTGPVPPPYGPTTNTIGTNFPNTLPGPTDYDRTIVPLTPTTSCGFPWGNLSTYAGIIVTKLQAPLYGFATQDTDCDPSTDADQIASPAFLANMTASPLFFYATIDAVSSCNGYFPDQDAQYWNDNAGAGYNTTNNVLTGDDFYLNFAQNYSESLPTVNIEAALGLRAPYGFYHSKRVAAGAANTGDDREPLPTAWAFNYFNGGGVTTSVSVFKTYHEFDAVHDLILACRPYIYYAWDENENSKARTVTTCPSGLCFGNPEPNVFPYETQMVNVTAANFTGLMSGNGWMLLVFDPSIPYFFDADYDNIQTFVFAKYNYGAYSTAVQATEMGNYWWNNSQILPVLNTNNGMIFE